MYELANKIKKVEAYNPMTVNCSVRLDANESCFNINELFWVQIANAVKGLDLNRYPDPLASGAVNAFAEYYGVSPDMVTAGNGSDELISVISSCLLEKGDRILTFSPDFSMYAFYGSLYELEVVTVQKESDLTVNLRKAAEYCNNNDIKAAVFSNPCNPTSLGIPREDVIRFIKDVHCLVIADEAYMDFWNQSVLDAVSDFDNLIILKTCSKAVGLAAIRLGFAVACREITEALRAVKSPYNTDAISQTVGELILSEKETLLKLRDSIVKNRNALQEGISLLAKEYTAIEKVYDSAANFIFIKSSKSKQIHERLLEKDISVRYMGNYLRVTAGTESENAAFLKALGDSLKGMVL